MAVQCTKCGAGIPAGKQSCPACGTSLSDQPLVVPQDETTHRHLIEANVLRLRKDFDAAIEHCTLILRQDPVNAPAHSLLGDIYRDKGDFREALGWYKLAVHLDGSNTTDRKKLNEMIDRVFQGAERQHARGTVEEPPPPPVNLVESVRGAILKVQPVHVALASAGLMVLVVSFVWLITSLSAHSHATTGNPTKPTGTAPSFSNLPLPTPNGMTSPLISPPAPDVIEIGRNPNTLGGTTPGANGTSQPRTIRPTTQPGNASTTTTTPPENTTTTPTNIQPTVVKPYPIGNEVTETTVTGDALRDDLQVAIDQSALPGVTVRSTNIGPSTDKQDEQQLTIEFVVPVLDDPARTKRALIFAGLHLTWAAMDKRKDLPHFYLRGFTDGVKGADPSLAFLANITQAHAEDAKPVTDYSTMLKYLDLPWWNQSLANVQV
jgi:hypothetical protein